MNGLEQILVFDLINADFAAIGELNQFDSITWGDKYQGHATFELWAPITKENAELLKEGNILWAQGDSACIIECIKSEVTEKGTKQYNVKGRTLESLLKSRIIWDNFEMTGYASDILYKLVSDNAVNPTDTKRKIPYLKLKDIRLQLGTQISYQKIDGDLYDACFDLAVGQDLGFNVLFRPKTKELIFEVIQGKDRTIDQTINECVEFSTDLEDILNSSYYMNADELKTTALVAGSGEGSARKRITTGNVSLTGFKRKELFVDARDLQPEKEDASGNMIPMPEAEYLNLLTQRGGERLGENKVVETFEANIRLQGEVQYQFGVDYFKGDKVTVRDRELNVVVSARITEVEESYDEKYELRLTFGYAYPTILQKVKKITK